MDEIDAALDFKNVSIVANYIKERTKNAQFIIISLREWRARGVKSARDPACDVCSSPPPLPPPPLSSPLLRQQHV
jgi:hypothetical protein